MTDDYQTSTLMLELPTHDTIEDYDVDLSDLAPDELDALEEANDELLNSGDAFDFPSDEALSASFELDRQIRAEREDRDPRRDDPYFDPMDTTDRFDLKVVAVEIYSTYGKTNVRLTFEDDSEFVIRGTSDLVGLIMDYHDLDGIRDASHLYTRTLPVVGCQRDPYDHEDPDRPWGRIDRYALEHGEPAI